MDKSNLSLPFSPLLGRESSKAPFKASSSPQPSFCFSGVFCFSDPMSIAWKDETSLSASEQRMKVDSREWLLWLIDLIPHSNRHELKDDSTGFEGNILN